MIKLTAQQIRLYAQLKVKRSELLGLDVEKRSRVLSQLFSHKTACVSTDKNNNKIEDLIVRYDNLIDQIERAEDKESLDTYFEHASTLVSSGDSREAAGYRANTETTLKSLIMG